ncbi:MAG: MotA/TolQ/ExbB proton channel family protein [Planctomycetota bacterium]|nr:MotA/TolQ/ExbB proton channel family protein [Planctomycetota bacterium]
MIAKRRMSVSRFPAWLIVCVVTALAGTVVLAQEAAGPAPAGPAAAANPAPASKPAAGAGETTIPKLTMWNLIKQGNWLMIPIGIASMMGVSIIIERLVALRRKKAVPPGFLDSLKDAYRQDVDNIQKGIAFCEAQDTPISRMLAVGLRHLDRDDLTVERAMEDIGLNEVTKLRHNLRLLFGVAAVAPMLGLLGSVSGMIQAFYSVSTSWNATGKGETLARGIYEALVTTYSGLVIAIPTLIFYYIFLNKIDAIVTDMNDMSRKFLEHYRTANAPALSVV